MHFKQISAICWAFCMLCACGSDEPTSIAKDDKLEIDNIRRSGEKMKERLNAYQKRREERIKRGDTLAMTYQELEQFLPEIEGFEKMGLPKGEQILMPGIGGWSKTKQQYTRTNALIEVEINDYNQSVNGFNMAAAVFSMNIQIENDREKSGSFDPGIAGVRGYEKLIKKTGRITHTYILSDRFLVRVDGKKDISSETLKKVAQHIPLAVLAAK